MEVGPDLFQEVQHLKNGFRSHAKVRSATIKTIAGLFDPAPNSTYGSFNLAKAVIKMGMDNSSAERQSNPSSDVILRRVHEVDEGEAKGKLGVLNELLLEHLPLPENPMIAIDLTTDPYYGEEDPSLVSDSRLPGTDLGIRFAVLGVIENGRTFTLWVKQVGPLKSEIPILREMLDIAEELFDPDLVFLDRG